MTPPLDERGLLPPGCHGCQDWAQFAAQFAFNAHRERLLGLAMAFVRDRLTPLATGLRLIIAGSYLSDKEQPGDIEMVVTIPLADIPNRIVLIDLFRTEGAKGPIWQDSKVDFYIHLEGLGGNNIALFFEYVGEKTAAAKGIDAKDRRGTLEIASWTLP